MEKNRRGGNWWLARVALAVLWSGLVVQQARALGLGDIAVESLLNEPLAAEISLLNAGNVDASQVLVSLAAPADYERIGVEREHFHTLLQFSVDIPPNATDGVIHVTTADKVVEPFINFLVDVRWPTGRILREYTVLLDLPIYSQAPQAPAPAELPVAAAAPQTAGTVPESLSGSQYQVSANDTLWEIASRSRPDGRASIFQMMIAIQQQNPQAFLNNNINLLRAGAMLDIPTEDQALAISSGESQAAVREQTQQWREETETPVQPLTASEDIAAPAATDAGYEGHLRLAAGEGSGTAAGAALEDGEGTATERVERLRDALASTSEELDAARRENADLQQRVELLEQQLQTTEELDSLKAQIESDELAAVETALTNAGQTAEAPATAGQEMATGATGDEGTSAPAAEPGAADAVAETGEPVAETGATGESAPAEVATPAGMVGQGKPPFPWRWVGIGGGLLLLLAAVIVWRRRTAYVEFDFEAEPAAPAPVVAPGQRAPAAKAKDTMATLDKAFEHFERGEGDTARAMVQAAIDKEPHRSDLRLGLLQMLAAIGDNDGVERQYAALQAIATPEELQRAENFLARSRAVQQQVAAARPAAGKVAALEDELADIDLDLTPAAAPTAAAIPELDIEPVEYVTADTGLRPFASADTAGQDAELDLDIDLGDFGELQDLELTEDQAIDIEAVRPHAGTQSATPDFAGLESDLAQEALELHKFSEPDVDAGEFGDLFQEGTAAANLELDAGQDEVATKLELAEAYIDMDDYDAAREILREVIADGNRAQQDRARELMGAIA